MSTKVQRMRRNPVANTCVPAAKGQEFFSRCPTRSLYCPQSDNPPRCCCLSLRGSPFPGPLALPFPHFSSPSISSVPALGQRWSRELPLRGKTMPRTGSFRGLPESGGCGISSGEGLAGLVGPGRAGGQVGLERPILEAPVQPRP